ncbi:hypothetical protein GCM10023201_44910 [Actinomycetospora corticicola]
MNEAARLCDLAKDVEGGVVGSGAAVARAGDEASRWTSIGSRTLRGRTTETEILAPTRLAGRRSTGSSEDSADRDAHQAASEAHEPA